MPGLSTGLSTGLLPGYLLPTGLGATYTYGSTVLHDSISLFLQQKPLASSPFTQLLTSQGRQPGVYKMGERQNQVSIPITIKVISLTGTRADLEYRLDVLVGGLLLRQQRLTLHASDTRYWIADATDVRIQYTSLTAALVSVTFVAAQPFLYDTVDYYESAVVGYVPFTLSGSNWVSSLVTMAGGGSARSYPTIALSNASPLAWSTVTSTINSGTNYTVISVAPIPFIWQSQYAYLQNALGQVQLVFITGTNLAGATSIAVTLFNSGFTFTAGTSILAPFGGATLTTALVFGTPTTTIACTAMPFSAGNNTQIELNDDAGHTQFITAPSGWTGGATSITVTSFTPNFSYPITTTGVLPSTTWQSVEITQLTDNVSIFSNLTSFSTFNLFNVMDYYCDVTQANGGLSLLNNTTLEPFAGALPYLDPTPTQWQLTIPANTVQPTALLAFTWTARWLS